MNKYGKFSKDDLEFIITRPDTPAPWVNYLSNGRYHGLISNTAGGFSFYESPRDNRITRWRYNSLPVDRPGRSIYFRDKKNGEYWSPAWQPVASKLEKYECRHGMYYTIISSEYKGIAAEITFFIAGDDLEIWKIKIKNKRREKVQLDIFTCVELCLGHALVDLINQPNDQHFNEVHFDAKNQILYASKRYWVTYSGPTVEQSNKEWDKYVFFASTCNITGFDGSRADFIGRWRSESNPLAVENGACFNTEITAGDAVSALQIQTQLAAGEEKECSFFTGIAPKANYLQYSRTVLEKYRNPEVINSEFTDLQNKWRNYISHVRIDTPDKLMNTMINVWNQYQTSVTFQFSREASYYHGGLLFGRGFRDSCQDILGPLTANQDDVRKRILEMSRKQFSDGSTYHLYYPSSGGGQKTGHSDTPLWFPFAVSAYLKETADFSLLDIRTDFADKGSATIKGHLFEAIEYSVSNLSDRLLAKFGPGDWNDTLDYLGRGGKGESIWVTMFLCYVLKETTKLCQYIGEGEKAEYFEKWYNKIKNSINKHCWDGQWYIRGTNDNGQIIGSHKNKQGKIFLNTQSWAIISGVADKDRALHCMNSVKEYLDTVKGPKILHPAYTEIDPTIGLATRCVHGKKENGAVFNHPVSWAILAECLLGRGDRAFDMYKSALPANPVINIDRYEVEPYVYAEYITSPDHKTYGQASHSWLTGSSAWMLRDGLDYICGIQPHYNGLKINPCIPASWQKFKVERIFRNIRFKFTFINPNKKNHGIKKITIENHLLDKSLIDLNDPLMQRLIADKNEIHVLAEM